MTASTHFRTGSFAKGLALVDAIGELAEAANHHPDIDLRYGGVTVRLKTHSEGGLTRARRGAGPADLGRGARTGGSPIDLTGLQTVQVAIDALVIPEVLPFWRAVLGYKERG